MRNTESPGQPLMQVNVAMQFQNRFFKLNDQSDGKSEFIVDSDVSVQPHKKSFNWKRLVAGRWNLMYSAVREIQSICSTNSRRFATTEETDPPNKRKRQVYQLNSVESHQKIHHAYRTVVRNAYRTVHGICTCTITASFILHHPSAS